MDVYQKIRKIINEADGILIGASNGSSIAEGYNLFADDLWFRERIRCIREVGYCFEVRSIGST